MRACDVIPQVIIVKLNYVWSRCIKNQKILREFLRYVLIALITAIIVVMLRVFLFASFKIPSFSMEPTLQTGDFILVNKLIPGSRIAILGNGEDGGPVRLAGRRPVRRNDVPVFNGAYHHSADITQKWYVYYVKRCVGIPGDTLSIRNGIYHINGRVNKISENEKIGRVREWETPPEFRSAGRFRDLGWTVHRFGPIYIPRKGDEIALDSINIWLYRSLIEYETGRKLTETEDSFLLDGRPYPQHRFDRNYYFMAGDNAADSNDSRYWGLLPEDHIVGKVAYIWKSKNLHTGEYRFDRFFKHVE